FLSVLCGEKRLPMPPGKPRILYGNSPTIEDQRPTNPRPTTSGIPVTLKPSQNLSSLHLTKRVPKTLSYRQLQFAHLRIPCFVRRSPRPLDQRAQLAKAGH